MSRREALEIIATAAKVRYERIYVPTAIRAALYEEPLSEKVWEAVGVLTGCPHDRPITVEEV